MDIRENLLFEGYVLVTAEAYTPAAAGRQKAFLEELAVLGFAFGCPDPDNPRLAIKRKFPDLFLCPDDPFGGKEARGQCLRISGGAKHRYEMLSVEHDLERKLAGCSFRPDPATCAIEVQRLDIFAIFHGFPLIVRRQTSLLNGKS